MTNTCIKSTPDKAEYINQMFNTIAPKYDLLNLLMTFGMHYKWKEDAIKLGLKEVQLPKNALDICTGTGDLAILLKKHSPETEITCIDNSKNMIELAEKKFSKLRLKNISLITKNFEASTFNQESFDFISIGFGLRNLIDKEKSTKSVFNLLNKNGVFACIDLGYPTNKFWQNIYFTYFFNTVPKLGEVIAKNKDAYTYLPNSLKSWLKQEELKSLLLNTGFKKCYFKNILGGIIAIHIAVK